MKKTMTTAALAAIILKAGMALAGTVDVPVYYDVDAKALKDGAPAGTMLTLELHALSDCSGSPVHSESLAIEALKIEAPKGITPKGAAKGAKTNRLAALLTGVTLPENSFLKVTGGGITPVGGACQAQSLSSGLPAGICVADPSASPRFVDNGDGTVTDRTTCLMWEQKNASDGVADLSNPHDVDNLYRWSSTGTAPDGSAFTDFLARVNGTLCDSVSCTGLGGHSDWRLPTIGELDGFPWPAPAALLPDASSFYWSASIRSGVPDAWTVYTSTGTPSSDGMMGFFFVRAVRSAS